MTNPKHHYFMSPHNDVGHFFDSVMDASVHRIRRGKTPAKIVYKDPAQFMSVRTRIKHFRTMSGGASREVLDALNSLETEALFSFEGVADQRPKIYVDGFGSPGSGFIRDRRGIAVGIRDLIAMFQSSHVPRDADLRMLPCWSGAGVNYQGDDWWERFHEGTLAEVSAVDDSLAAKVHKEMEKTLGFQGTTSGYLTPTTVQAQSHVIERGGRIAAGSHMAGVRMAQDARGDFTQSFDEHRPRRRNLRVRFPAMLTV